MLQTGKNESLAYLLLSLEEVEWIWYMQLQLLDRSQM